MSGIIGPLAPDLRLPALNGFCKQHLKRIPDAAFGLIRSVFKPTRFVQYHRGSTFPIRFPFAEALAAGIAGAREGQPGILDLLRQCISIRAGPAKGPIVVTKHESDFQSMTGTERASHYG